MLIKSLLAITLVAAAGVESASLARTYADETSRTYTLLALNKEQDFKFEADLTYKVAGKAKDDLTPVKVTSPAAKVSMGGNVVEEEVIDQTFYFDKHGMPSDLVIEGQLIAVAVTSASAFLPGKEVEVGKEYDIKWERSMSLNGKGTLEKVEERNGKKVATIRIEANFKPDGDRNFGKLKSTSEVDLATGWPISTKGSVGTEDEGTFEFTVKLKQ